jgi:hypothetical protein
MITTPPTCGQKLDAFIVRAKDSGGGGTPCETDGGSTKLWCEWDSVLGAWIALRGGTGIADAWADLLTDSRLTGLDSKAVTGTKGATNDPGCWNVDGDLVACAAGFIDLGTMMANGIVSLQHLEGSPADPGSTLPVCVSSGGIFSTGCVTSAGDDVSGGGVDVVDPNIIGAGPITVVGATAPDPDTITVDLALATDPGLEVTGSALRVDADDGLQRTAAGLAVAADVARATGDDYTGGHDFTGATLFQMFDTTGVACVGAGVESAFWLNTSTNVLEWCGPIGTGSFAAALADSAGNAYAVVANAIVSSMVLDGTLLLADLKGSPAVPGSTLPVCAASSGDFSTGCVAPASEIDANADTDPEVFVAGKNIFVDADSDGVADFGFGKDPRAVTLDNCYCDFVGIDGTEFIEACWFDASTCTTGVCNEEVNACIDDVLTLRAVWGSNHDDGGIVLNLPSGNLPWQIGNEGDAIEPFMLDKGVFTLKFNGTNVKVTSATVPTETLTGVTWTNNQSWAAVTDAMTGLQEGDLMQGDDDVWYPILQLDDPNNKIYIAYPYEGSPAGPVSSIVSKGKIISVNGTAGNHWWTSVTGHGAISCEGDCAPANGLSDSGTRTAPIRVIDQVSVYSRTENIHVKDWQHKDDWCVAMTGDDDAAPETVSYKVFKTSTVNCYKDVASTWAQYYRDGVKKEHCTALDTPYGCCTGVQTGPDCDTHDQNPGGKGGCYMSFTGGSWFSPTMPTCNGQQRSLLVSGNGSSVWLDCAGGCENTGQLLWAPHGTTQTTVQNVANEQLHRNPPTYDDVNPAWWVDIGEQGAGVMNSVRLLLGRTTFSGTSTREQNVIRVTDDATYLEVTGSFWNVKDLFSVHANTKTFGKVYCDLGSADPKSDSGATSCDSIVAVGHIDSNYGVNYTSFFRNFGRDNIWLGDGTGTDSQITANLSSSDTEVILNENLIRLDITQANPWDWQFQQFVITNQGSIILAVDALAAGDKWFGVVDDDGSTYFLRAFETGNVEFGKGSGFTHTYKTGGTPPVLTAASGELDLTTGSFKENSKLLCKADGTDCPVVSDLVDTGLLVGEVLRATSGTTFDFGPLDLASSNAVTGILPDAYVANDLIINQISLGTFDMDRTSPGTNEGRLAWNVANYLMVGDVAGTLFFYPICTTANEFRLLTNCVNFDDEVEANTDVAANTAHTAAPGHLVPNADLGVNHTGNSQTLGDGTAGNVDVLFDTSGTDPTIRGSSGAVSIDTNGSPSTMEWAFGATTLGNLSDSIIDVDRNANTDNFFQVRSNLTTNLLKIEESDLSTETDFTFSHTGIAGYDLIFANSGTNVNVRITDNLFHMTAGHLIVDAPTTQTITEGGTVTADACGSMKLIDSASNVETGTVVFTAPSESNDGCVMHVCNVGTTYTVNLKGVEDSSNFDPTAAVDPLPLLPDACVIVGSTGSIWYQLATASAN